MDLEVGARQAGARRDERARLQELLATQAGAAEQVLEPDYELVQPARRGEAGDEPLAAPVHDDVEMILQVLADAGQVVNWLLPRR
ncbi:hypothetical protein [uncultured Sphingomonas sp.]|uniref:hypothetical protein n=1 Tax=uncultured Sphingomonas sp. TaxID=158754 RepID=UPI0035CB7233